MRKGLLDCGLRERGFESGREEKAELTKANLSR